MKHFKRLNMYKASNVTYCPDTQKAFSYDWWQFTANINGHLVFNSYTYSPTTNRHQSKVRRLMNRLGHTPTIVIECPAGLQSHDWKISSLEHYRQKIEALVTAMVRGHKKKNLERIAQVAEYRAKMDLILSI